MTRIQSGTITTRCSTTWKPALRIKFSPRALGNLAELRQYYLDVGGNTLALRMVRGIRDEVAALADNPNIAPAYELAPGLRRRVVAQGAFLVFYRVNTLVEVVHVGRVERQPFDGETTETGR